MEKLQQVRIFLAGDAAHTMTSYRGQGANSGIADVHNLAWKLAAVINGKAGRGLLETYDVERLPVGRKAARESANTSGEGGLLDARKSLWTVWLMIGVLPMLLGWGYKYVSDAIVPEATAESKWFWWWNVPWSISSLVLGLNGSPGTRVPHIWVQYEGQKISTLDLFGKNFVLIARSNGKSWCEAANKLSSELGIEVKAYRAGPTGDLSDPKREWDAAAGIASQGAVLVRPDGFVAWRVQNQLGDLKNRLEAVLKQVLTT